MTDDQGLHCTIRDYYSFIFKDSARLSLPDVSYINSFISQEDAALLDAPFILEKFRVATFQMYPDKAAGPDGLNLCFYQHF